MLRESFVSKFDAIEEGFEEDEESNLTSSHCHQASANDSSINDRRHTSSNSTDKRVLHTEMTYMTEIQPWWQIMANRMNKQKKREEILSRLESLRSMPSGGGDSSRDAPASAANSSSSWWQQRAEELKRENSNSREKLDGRNNEGDSECGGEGYSIMG